MDVSNSAYQAGLQFIHDYNRCFYERDIDRLKGLYSAQGFTVFWDNHAGCDSDRLEDHFDKLADFFANEKDTESGTIEELLIEDVQVHASANTLIVSAMLRYASVPKPGVRSTFVLTQEDAIWKAVHIHHSFDPNEQN